MKALVVLLAFLAVGYAVPKYRSFEDIDIKSYRDHKTVLNSFFNCMTGKGVCDKQDAQFKARGNKIVETFCEDCREKEKRITRDLFSLITQDDPFKLHTLLKIFDPDSRNSRSFLLWIRNIKSLYNIPDIPSDVINEFNDIDEGDEEYDDVSNKRGKSKFVKRGGLLGGLRRLLRGLLGVVGV